MKAGGTPARTKGVCNHEKKTCAESISRGACRIYVPGGLHQHHRRILASEASSSSAASSEASSEAQSSAAESSEEAGGEAASTLSGNISTGGSTSMEQVISALQEGFVELNPDVTITYDPTGSGAGITGAMEGSLDIGLSSRDLKEDETGVTGTTIALDGISIIVNTENTVTDLTIDDLAKIARGEITNWSELGGPDGEIVFVGREAGSGTRDGFESIVGVEDECVYAEELWTIRLRPSPSRACSRARRLFRTAPTRFSVRSCSSPTTAPN